MATFRRSKLKLATKMRFLGRISLISESGNVPVIFSRRSLLQKPALMESSLQSKMKLTNTRKDCRKGMEKILEWILMLTGDFLRTKTVTW